MNDIPEPYVKVNQIGIVLSVIAASLFREPYVLLVLWLVQITGLLFGKNLFVIIVKPFLKVDSAPRQAGELQRFNNVLAVLFLTGSMLGFALQVKWLGYGFSWMLGVAAFAAICGYCIGCTVYFQFKQYKAKLRRG